MNINPVGNTTPITPGGISQSNPITTYKQLTTTLSALQTASPSDFVSFALNASSELKAAAQNQPAGETQNFLNFLSNTLQNAAANPSAPIPTGQNYQGSYRPGRHPVAESFMKSLNMQAQSMLNQLS